MTKEEIKEYINQNGHADDVLEAVRELVASGKEVTKESLDEKLGWIADEEFDADAVAEKAAEEVVRVFPSELHEEPEEKEVYKAEEKVEPKVYEEVRGRAKEPSKFFVPMVVASVLSVLGMFFGYILSDWVLIDGAYTMTRPSLLIFIAAFLSCFVTIASEWKVFTKAGEKGWKVFIPIYNVWLLYQIVFGNGWKMFFLLIPFYNIYWAIKTYVELGHRFGKRGGFCVGLIFLNTVFMTILAFDGSRYEQKRA